MAKNEATLLIRIKETGGEALDKIKGGLGAIAGIAAAAGAALVAGVAAGTAAFREQEKATNSLNQALVQQGIYTPELSKKYQDMASALQKVTTFGDETIVSSQAQLQAYLGQTEITEDLMKATLDFASAMKVDLKTAADLVGKTVGSSTNALGRYGIEIDGTATKAEKLAAVQEALNNRFGGQAEAAAGGLGAIEQMKNALGDVLEVVGAKFAPFISFAAKQITIFAESLQTNSNFLTGLYDSALFAAKGVSYLKNIVVGVSEVIGTGLAAAIQSIVYITEGEFTKAKEIAALGMDEVGTLVKERKNILNEELNAIDQLQAETDEEKRQQESILIKNSLDRNAQIKLDAKAKENAEAITEQQKQDAKLLGLEIKQGMKSVELQKQIDAAKEQGRRDSLNTISSLQSSNNKELAAIGKAAGITSIAIDTPVAVSKALAAFPPPFNFIAAALVGAAMAVQAARIAGIQLADGGIVSATQGGTPAILGEAGRDEAVIPLDGAGGGFGTTVNITVMGGLLGDAQSAREFARAVDEELLKLRRNNESVSFDSGVA